MLLIAFLFLIWECAVSWVIEILKWRPLRLLSFFRRKFDGQIWWKSGKIISYVWEKSSRFVSISYWSVIELQQVSKCFNIIQCSIGNTSPKCCLTVEKSLRQRNYHQVKGKYGINSLQLRD